MKTKRFEIFLQLHGGGKGGGSTTVQAYEPTAEEKRLWGVQADIAEGFVPNIQYTNNLARDLLEGSLGSVQVDFNKYNQQAQQQINQAQQNINNLSNGLLPAQYQANMENAIRSGVENTMGNMVNSLGNRGILNSSVTNTAMNDISKNASDAMAQQYQQNMGFLDNLYNNQIQTAGQKGVVGAAMQEGAIDPAVTMWNASVGMSGNNNSTLAALGGKGTATTTQNMSGGGGMGGFFNGALGAGIAAYCFTDDTNIKTKNGNELIRHIGVGDTITAIDADGNEFEDEVIDALEPRMSDVYVVITANANNAKGAVSTTLTQPLMLESGEWKEVAILRIGDKLKNIGKVTGIVHSGERKIYDLKLKKGVGYYANGIVAKSATNEW